MSFKVSRQRMFYAGATLSASAAIGFGILRAQDYGLKHPHALEVWIAVCVIAAVVLAIVGAMSNEESSAPKATNTAQTTHGDGSPIGGSGDAMTAGRDLSGSQFHGSIVGDSAIEKLLAARPSSLAATQPPPQPQPRKQSRIEVFDAEHIRARFQNNAWKESTQGDEECAVISVYNPPAEIGERSVTINPLSAHLIFREDGKNVATVAKAYWLDAFFNEVSIGPGDRRFLVLWSDKRHRHVYRTGQSHGLDRRYVLRPQPLNTETRIDSI